MRLRAISCWHWAAVIVEAVRPVGVWVVVDASRKTSDVAHHLQGLRRVDAICLRGTMSSGDPASPSRSAAPRTRPSASDVVGGAVAQPVLGGDRVPNAQEASL